MAKVKASLVFGVKVEITTPMAPTIGVAQTMAQTFTGMVNTAIVKAVQVGFSAMGLKVLLTDAKSSITVDEVVP